MMNQEKFVKKNGKTEVTTSCFLEESDCFATASLHKSREEFLRDLSLNKETNK
jgi:hypothetical protein